jgi:hypothetical protein
VTGVASKLGSFQLLAGDWAQEASYLHAVRRASAEDLLRVAREYLEPARACVAAVLPEGAPPALDAARLGAALGDGVRRVERAFRVPARREAGAGIHAYELPPGGHLYVLPRR